MVPRQFLPAMLVAWCIALPFNSQAQASQRPAIVPPSFSIVKPLELGPAVDPRDRIELSALPVDFGVEHPLLIEIVVFQHEPLPESERDPNDPSRSRVDTWSVRLATDGTPSGGGYSGYLFAGEFQSWGPGVPLSPDSLAKVKSLIATLPRDRGVVPPRNHKVEVEMATSHGTEKRMYDAANLPEAVLEIFRLTGTHFPPPPR